MVADMIKYDKDTLLPSITIIVTNDTWKNLIELAGILETDQFLYVNEARGFVLEIKSENKHAT